MSKDKKKTSKIGNIIETIYSWYVADENGKKNEPNAILFTSACILPFVIFEGVKVGLYDAFAPNSANGMTVLGKGLLTPFVEVMKQKQRAAFGNSISGFNPLYLGCLLVIFFVIVTTLWIQADRNRNKSSIKDGDAKFVPIKQYNKELAEPQGEPGFAEPEEDQITADHPGNMIISKNARFSLAGSPDLYSCAFILGPIGSGKSFKYVKPNILQMNASYVITDPKCELIRDLGKALMDHGYDVRLFNLKKGEQQFSCRYNPFKYIHDEQDVILAVDAFLDATGTDGGTGGDPFFPIAEKNFYYFLFYYVWTQFPEEKQTLKSVYEVYAKAKEADTAGGGKNAKIIENELDKLIRQVSEEDPTNPCLSFYNTFKNGSPKTKQSILISVGVKLWFLSVTETANLLSGDDLNFEMYGDRKMALFVAIPTDNDSFRCLSAMMFTQLFQTLYYVGGTVNPNSYLLKKGNCVAARSEQFIIDTDQQEKAKEALLLKQNIFKEAELLDENELRKTDALLDQKLNTSNNVGIKPWPQIHIAVKKMDFPNLKGYETTDDGKYWILESFKSLKAAEIVLDAARNGTIELGTEGHINRIRFILDEFFAIGKIAGFDAKIATFRSLKISSDVIVQNITQLKEMYDDKEGKVIDNCDIKICLGAGGLEDAKYFSDMVGQTTVQSESTSLSNKGVILAQTADGHNVTDNAQMLVRPEWLMSQMKGSQCLVFTRTQGAFKDKKYVATEHPRWKETYNSRDKSTEDRIFPYRKMFCIEQDPKNKIVTIIKDPNEEAKQKQLEDFANALDGAIGDAAKALESVNRGNKKILYAKTASNPIVNRHDTTSDAFNAHAKSKTKSLPEVYNEIADMPKNEDGLIDADKVSDSMKERLRGALKTGTATYDPVEKQIHTKNEDAMNDALGDMLDSFIN